MAADPRPWLECVDLHSDVLSDEFSEDVFALDLGALSDHLIGTDLGLPAADLPRVPAVYRDAGSFFLSSYLTSGLRSLLDDVLGRLTGAHGNRVLKLLTPFGGGKSHTLAALLHAARTREALDALPEAAGLPRPERVRVAVFDGQFFDATRGKRAPDSEITARTIWGWIAWALDGSEGYELARAQDEARVAPGGDAIVALLKRGPSLILIDELLEYLISAGGVRVEQTTLRDETLSFLKRLTVAVGNVDNGVLVYSLQSSKRESLEYTSLLNTVEHLAARKDQRREPVEGNEILNVIQRRLLARMPESSVAMGVAEAHRQVFTQMRRAYASGEPVRQQAEEDGLALRDRIMASYPFHPALVDLMRERWAAIPEFQRTRGALRFLAASCLRAGPSSRPLPAAARPGRSRHARQRRSARLLQGGRTAGGLPGLHGARLHRSQRTSPEDRRSACTRGHRRVRSGARDPARDGHAPAFVRGIAPKRERDGRPAPARHHRSRAPGPRHRPGPRQHDHPGVPEGAQGAMPVSPFRRHAVLLQEGPPTSPCWSSRKRRPYRGTTAALRVASGR